MENFISYTLDDQCFSYLSLSRRASRSCESFVKNCHCIIKWQWQTPKQQQNFAIPIKITDEIANLSTIKVLCLGNSGFDIESCRINIFFKERTIKQKMSYIPCTMFANQTEGAISASVPWYTTNDSKITHKPDLNVHGLTRSG